VFGLKQEPEQALNLVHQVKEDGVEMSQQRHGEGLSHSFMHETGTRAEQKP
jgi:hypothetical protein